MEQAHEANKQGGHAGKPNTGQEEGGPDTRRTNAEGQNANTRSGSDDKPNSGGNR